MHGSIRAHLEFMTTNRDTVVDNSSFKRPLARHIQDPAQPDEFIKAITDTDNLKYLASRYENGHRLHIKGVDGDKYTKGYCVIRKASRLCYLQQLFEWSTEIVRNLFWKREGLLFYMYNVKGTLRGSNHNQIRAKIRII